MQYVCFHYLWSCQPSKQQRIKDLDTVLDLDDWTKYFLLREMRNTTFCWCVSLLHKTFIPSSIGDSSSTIMNVLDQYRP